MEHAKIWRMIMRRITIRNLRSHEPVKPRIFDVIVDGNEVYIKIKGKNTNTVVSLRDAMEQITEPGRQSPAHRYRLRKPDSK